MTNRVIGVTTGGIGKGGRHRETSGHEEPFAGRHRREMISSVEAASNQGDCGRAKLMSWWYHPANSGANDGEYSGAFNRRNPQFKTKAKPGILQA